jgi:predicted DCC family thiol-disulfide oxidoreductase YuxK
VAAQLTVFYDADCGVCTMTARILHIVDTARRLRLTPLQHLELLSPGDPDRHALLSRLHARDANGRWSAGGDAVREIAAAIPLLFPLSIAGRLPGLRHAVDAGYELIARNREPIGRWLGVDRCRIDPERLA